jgi:hypothetical protein
MSYGCKVGPKVKKSEGDDKSERECLLVDKIICIGKWAQRELEGTTLTFDN